MITSIKIIEKNKFAVFSLMTGLYFIEEDSKGNVNQNLAIRVSDNNTHSSDILINYLTQKIFVKTNDCEFSIWDYEYRAEVKRFYTRTPIVKFLDLYNKNKCFLVISNENIYKLKKGELSLITILGKSLETKVSILS